MNTIFFNGPINSLSLGNVSVNFMRELIRRDKLEAVFPHGDQAEFSAFDRLDEKIKAKIVSFAQMRLQLIDADIPVLRNWHINGSEQRVVPNQYLYTYYEVDSPTLEEIMLVRSQKHVFFSSSEAAEIFKMRGLENVSSVPLGFDPDFQKEEVEGLDSGIVHFGLVGKLEQRKNTQKIIKLWLKKFGNNPDFHLTCLINNPFFEEKMYNQVIMQTLEGKPWNNINFLPHLKKNSEVNKLLNAIDIDLSGLSSGEGWNLPSFNSTGLGKWSIVSNCSSHKDWATEKNSILVEPVGKRPCYDGIFFKEGSAFNQGKYYDIPDEGICEALDKAVDLAKSPNPEGEKLREEFSYEKTLDKILEVMEG